MGDSHLGTWAALTGPNFFFFKGQSWVRKHVEEMREKLGLVDKYHNFFLKQVELTGNNEI